MTKIVGKNRFSHQTLTTSGLTFSVPPSEDFTDGTWNINGSQLCLSEIGINEADNKAYVRIGSNINEFQFVGATSGGLPGTLRIDNNSGTYSIIMGTNTSIKSANGGGQIDLDLNADEVLISNDGGQYTKSQLFISNNYTELSNYVADMFIYAKTSMYLLTFDSSSKLTLGNNTVLLSKSNTNAGKLDLTSSGGYNIADLSSENGYIRLQVKSSDDLIVFNTASASYTSAGTDKSLSVISARDITIQQNSHNGAVIGGNWGSLSVGASNSVYMAKINMMGDGYNSSNVPYIHKYNITSLTQSTATASTIASISLNNDETITINAIVNAYCSSPNRNLSARLMASFMKYGGTIYQTSTTDSVIKDGFGDGTTATIDTDGTSIRIRVTNGSTLATRYVASYDYIVSGT